MWTRLADEHLFFLKEEDYLNDPDLIKYVNVKHCYATSHLFNLKIYLIRMASEARELKEFEKYLDNHELTESQLKALCPDWFGVMLRILSYKDGLEL